MNESLRNLNATAVQKVHNNAFTRISEELIANIVMFLGAFYILIAPSGAIAADMKTSISAYENGDRTTALKTFHELAADGDANAQYFIGEMYVNGSGVAKNDETAVAGLEKGPD